MIGGGGAPVLKRSRCLFLRALTAACPHGFLVSLQLQIAGNERETPHARETYASVGCWLIAAPFIEAKIIHQLSYETSLEDNMVSIKYRLGVYGYAIVKCISER